MKAVRGGRTYEVGRYPITIVPTREVDRLHRLAARAVRRMAERPNLLMPHLSDCIILSFRTEISPAEALRQFTEALAACEADE